MKYMESDKIYDVILAVRNASGIKAKQHILLSAAAADQYIKRWLPHVLCWGMDPYAHYGVTVSRTTSHGSGNSEMTKEHYEVLVALAKGALTGYAAKNAVRKMLTSMTFKTAALMTCVLNKNFAFGLGTKSVNQVFPGLIPTHDIQLAKPIDYKRVQYPVFVSPKLDGLRAIYKHGKLFSRLGNEFKGLTKLKEALHSMCLGGMQLDGELMVEGEHFNEISGQLRSFKETDNAVFNVFDIPNLSQTQDERLRVLSTLCTAPGVQVVEHSLAHDENDIQDLYQDALTNGYEGVMVKATNAIYEGARTWAWMKVKPSHSVDLKVTGLFEGHGKYEGLCGGLTVDFNGVSVRVGSGLSDAQRSIWADDCSDILGATIEVAYQEITPDGSLRHPRLKTVRGDK